MDDLKSKIRHVPDFPKAGILFYDITTLMQDAAGFRAAIDGLSLPFRNQGIDLVVGIESRGFIFGAAVADRIGAGFSPVRKPGKLPSKRVTATYALEYGTDALEIHDDAVKKGQLTFAVFHLLGSSIASLNEIEETSLFTTDAKYFLVKNFINNTTFFEWDPATYNSYFKRIKGAEEITIPKLNEMAYEQVEVASVPFVSFVGNKGVKNEAANYSFVLRGYVRHWLGNVWGEYDRVKLIDLVAPKMESNVRQAAG